MVFAQVAGPGIPDLEDIIATLVSLTLGVLGALLGLVALVITLATRSREWPFTIALLATAVIAANVSAFFYLLIRANFKINALFGVLFVVSAVAFIPTVAAWLTFFIRTPSDSEAKSLDDT
jgi:hypothetical protein